jgi:hypothetical protein
LVCPPQRRVGTGSTKAIARRYTVNDSNAAAYRIELTGGKDRNRCKRVTRVSDATECSGL